MFRFNRIPRFFGLFFFLFCLSVAATAASFFETLELSFEKTLGEDIYQKIIEEKKVVQLPAEEAERLNSIFGRIASASSRKAELSFSLTVVEDETVNAFALPAGYIFVHTGLLAFTQSDDEIAGVLAHEVAHVDRKHSMKAIKRQLGMSLLLRLIMNPEDSPETLRKIGALAVNLAQLGYSREEEFEADRYGVYFMEKAGYQRKELINFWERMREASGGENNPAFLYLFSTHPPTTERIERIRNLP